MYSRDEAKALTDKVLNMAKADAVEVVLTGGERSGTRWANSSITTNLVQYDRQISVTVRRRTEARQRVHARLQRRGPQGDGRRSDRRGASRPTTVRICRSCSARSSTSRSTRRCPTMVNFGPGERAKMVKDEHRPLREDGRARRRLHPEDRSDELHGQLERPVRVLPRRRGGLRADVPHGRTAAARAGRASRACKDLELIDAAALTEVAVEQGAQEPEAEARSSRAATRRFSSRAPTRASCR